MKQLLTLALQRLHRATLEWPYCARLSTALDRWLACLEQP